MVPRQPDDGQHRPKHVVVSITVIKYTSVIKLCLTTYLLLVTVLNTVRFGTGISAHVFSTLRCTLQTMSDEGHLCCLTFDEMSIRQNLHFSQKFDSIQGLEDLGSHSRTSSIANHAPVFMLPGFHKKWKQPVTYFVIHRSGKGELLVNFLCKSLMCATMQDWKVFAIMCDMDAKNVKALKMLGVSEKTPFFRFQN